MKKKLFALLLSMVLVAGMAVTAQAESYQGESGWKVSFSSSKKMENNFKSKNLTEAASGLLPGDDITFTLTLENNYSAATDWWMKNTVLQSFEDKSVANGGAYSYVLTYTDSSGRANVLYSSDTVGGENKTGGEGLHEATDALKDYFYIGTLSSKKKGTITLKVALDGETQVNNYQDTLADLQMNFAVEINNNDNNTNSSANSSAETVKTGDVTDIIPWLLLMACSGIVLLLGGFIYLRRSREEEEAV